MRGAELPQGRPSIVRAGPASESRKPLARRATTQAPDDGDVFGSVKNRDVFVAGYRDVFTPVPKNIRGIRSWTEPDELHEAAAPRPSATLRHLLPAAYAEPSRACP